MTNKNIYSKHYTPIRGGAYNVLKECYKSFKEKIPDGAVVVAEYMYKRKSIPYDKLTSYLYVSDYIAYHCYQHIGEVKKIASKLHLPTVPIIWTGNIDEDEFNFIVKNYIPEFGDTYEGFVIRNRSPLFIHDYTLGVAKYINPKFVKVPEHWIHKEIIKNKIKEV